jgi:hypothetical protein
MSDKSLLSLCRTPWQAVYRASKHCRQCRVNSSSQASPLQRQSVTLHLRKLIAHDRADSESLFWSIEIPWCKNTGCMPCFVHVSILTCQPVEVQTMKCRRSCPTEGHVRLYSSVRSFVSTLCNGPAPFVPLWGLDQAAFLVSVMVFSS